MEDGLESGLEAKQEGDKIEIVEKEEVSMRIESPDIFDEGLMRNNDESEKVEAKVEKKIEKNTFSAENPSFTQYSWAAGSQSPDIFENENDCLLLEDEQESLLYAENEEKSNKIDQKSPILNDNERAKVNNESLVNVSDNNKKQEEVADNNARLKVNEESLVNVSDNNKKQEEVDDNNERLKVNDESDNIKKQETIFAEKSILEIEMEIMNKELEEQDDDVLSLSASSLSDFELEEDTVKNNMKTKIETQPKQQQPLPPQQQQNKVKTSRFSPLIPTTMTTNFDNVMAPTISFKSFSNSNYRIPKVMNTSTTIKSTPAFAPQQQQQQQWQQQAQISTKILVKPTAYVMPKAPTTTTTLEHIDNFSKNAEPVGYAIVPKPAVQQEVEVVEVENYLEEPVGENFGRSNLDLACIFGIECLTHPMSNEMINYEMCDKSHTLLDGAEVTANLSLLNKEDFFAAYRFAKNNQKLFDKYFICFTSTLTCRKNIDALSSMIYDCRLYPKLSATVLSVVFAGLKECGMEANIACRSILKRLLENPNEKYFHVLHAALDLLIVAGHWTRFTCEIDQMLNIKNFIMNFSFVRHMIDTCLNLQLEESYSNLTLRCLLHLSPEASEQLGSEPNVIKFLQLIQNYKA